MQGLPSRPISKIPALEKVFQQMIYILLCGMYRQITFQSSIRFLGGQDKRRRKFSKNGWEILAIFYIFFFLENTSPTNKTFILGLTDCPTYRRIHRSTCYLFRGRNLKKNAQNNIFIIKIALWFFNSTTLRWNDTVWVGLHKPYRRIHRSICYLFLGRNLKNNALILKEHGYTMKWHRLSKIT